MQPYKKGVIPSTNLSYKQINPISMFSTMSLILYFGFLDQQAFNTAFWYCGAQFKMLVYCINGKEMGF